MSKPSIVFAHGLWADGSCFQKVIPTLQAEGHDVIAAQYGLDSLKGDVEATRRTIARTSGPVVLVGHSYGGTVITHAGVDPRVAALVYLSALAPDETETSQSLLEKYPPSEILKHIEVTDGRIWLKPSAPAAFAGDLTPEEQKLIYATHVAPTADILSQKHEGVAWRGKPSWFVVPGQDDTIQPDLERFVAKRMGAKTVELKSSHVVMLSHPREVLDVIRQAVAAATAKA